MKISSAIFVLCLAVKLVCARELGRTYDNDHQHKRSAPAQHSYSHQPLGYEAIETTSEFWRRQAQRTIAAKLFHVPGPEKAKNVVYFIGDGMSAQTMAATRMYLGNENTVLSFEGFPYSATAKTYCVDRQVADSACTATAYLSGVKTNFGMINVAPEVPRYSCEHNRTETEFLGLLKWAQDNNMATGVVTTSRVTHATPAGTYASVTDRDWEDDRYVAKDGCDPSKYPDIAAQLIHGEVGKKLKVILGGGRRHFIPSTQLDEENIAGSRADGRNLINEWKEMHGASAQYVWNKTGFQSIIDGKSERLLGLFDSSHCLYNLEIEEKNLQSSKPKLSEMVDVAIKMLSRSDTGFFLFVEGGKIDMAHHENRPRLALDETAELSSAVDLARRMTNVADTLIVVSADHGHTMMYNGYPKRGSNVLGVADLSDEDGLPYTTLSYANGEGYYGTFKEENRGVRTDISNWDFTDFRLQYPATVPLTSAAHGGEDVVVFARGPMAHLFRGNVEQHAIAHLIAYAAQIGYY